MKTKNRIEDLAIFGAKPAFEEPLHVGRPNIGRREPFLERVNAILDQRWLTNNGPCVQQFERAVAKLLGVRHCIAVCNGTIALELAIRALQLKGEVIVPSFTFIATAHALQWQGITPVFCDVVPSTHSIDPRCVEELITPRTTGIIGVHLWGKPCAVETLADIARRRGLELMFDAAHAFGCSHQGRMIGNFGRAEVFSFHATKFLNTLEGGAVTTNDDELAESIRLMKNFGFAGLDKVVCLGTNGKMNEISAAMGLTGLESMDDFIEHNYRNYRQYLKELENLPGLCILPYDESEKCNYQYVVLEVDDTASPLTRDELMKVLWAENVLARRYFYPGCHRMEPYVSRFPDAGARLRETEKLARRVLVLPTGTSVGLPEISLICRIIGLALTHWSLVKERISGQSSLDHGSSGRAGA
jgi:dTDP-4-amino-4,6-dideoxygalactose transaminase